MPFDLGFGGDGGIFGEGSWLSGIGDITGKPDTGEMNDLAGQVRKISAAEQQRRLALQEPLRQELFGTPAGFATDPTTGRPLRDAKGNKIPTAAVPGQFQSFLTSGTLPTALQVPTTAHQEAIALQGQQARGDILSRIPAQGGQLNQLLAMQRLSEAQQVGQIPLMELPLRHALFQQAVGTAVGSEFPVVPGFGTAGGIMTQANQANQAYKDNVMEIAGVAAGGMG